MKTPSFRTWLLGSRFTAPFLIGGAGWYAWQWWQAGGPDNTGLAAIALILFSARAAYQVACHRKWRADWRAMSPNQSARRYCTALAKMAIVIAMLSVGGGLYWAAQVDASVHPQGNLMPLAVLSAMLGIALLIVRGLYRIWARWRPRRQQRLPAVTLAIKRPICRPLSMAASYRRLPPYCQMLLKGAKP